MNSAYLYNRDKNILKSLDAPAVLASRPSTDEGAQSPQGHVNGSFARTLPHCGENELMWIDIVAPDETDYEMLIQRFDVHPMVVEDLKGSEGRPKLHDYGDYIYVIFHALRYVQIEDEDAKVDHKGGHNNAHKADALRQATIPTPEVDGSAGGANKTFDLRLCEIDCLVGSDYVITLHCEPLQPFEDLKRRWERRPELMREGASYLLYELMDEVLDDYFPLLDALDERIDEFEDRLFLEFQETLSADIFALKRCLIQVRRIAGPTRDVANILLRRDADAGGKHFAYFQDLYDHAVRIVDMVDNFRDILSGALDAYLAMASNRMNAVMKTLTSASIILLVPTLIAGIYGMNFDTQKSRYNMPELLHPYGYPITLGAMFVIMVVLGLLFWRKRWL